MAKLSLYLDTRYMAKGKYPIRICVSHRGQNAVCALGISIEEQYWQPPTKEKRKLFPDIRPTTTTFGQSSKNLRSNYSLSGRNRCCMRSQLQNRWKTTSSVSLRGATNRPSLNFSKRSSRAGLPRGEKTIPRDIFQTPWLYRRRWLLIRASDPEVAR